MLDNTTRKRIDDCRDILVGKLPDPKSQIEQITIALIYKFMDDMDKESVELGGAAKFFSDYKIPDPQYPDDREKDQLVDFKKYAWDNLLSPKVTAAQMLALYSEAIERMEKNPNIPPLFRDIFKNAYLPYRDPETLKLFLKTIGEFEYTHSEKLGDAFEYLLSVMGSQGDAGQFRTPRHIIDFLVAAVNPSKTDTLLDPACGTAGFLVSAFKHILNQNNHQLTPDERKKLIRNFVGYDISPDMVRLSLVNLYLHGFSDPHIWEYDTLSSEERWDESYDVILANPPFMSPKGGIRPHKKFTISSNRSEVLFVDYIAEHLNPKGRAGIIVPEGVIFQSGTAYKDLRKILVENYLYAVVSLPAGVFNPYSGVKTSILLMDKELAKETDQILFIKIDNDGYNLGAQRTAIKGSHLEEALESLKDFRTSISEAQAFKNTSLALAVSKIKIAEKGDWNLSGERYKSIVNNSSVYEFVALEDLAEITSSKRIFQEEYVDEGIPFYRTKEIVELNKKKAISLELFISKEKYTEIKERFGVPKKGDILISAVGTLGVPWLIEDDREFYFKDGNLIWIKDIKNAIPAYVKHVLELTLINQLTTLSIGAAYKALTIIGLKKIQIPLPPLSIQEEIVAEIEGYQKIIDGAKMVVDNYKPKIDIDPEWEIVQLGEVCDSFQYGSSKKSLEEGDIPCLRMGNIQNGEIDWQDLKYAPEDEEFDKYLLNKNDVLFNRTNSPVHVGKTAIYRGERKAVFAGYVIRLVYQKDKITGEYLNYCLNTKAARDFCWRVKTDGINQSNINAKILATFQIPLPPIESQRQIVARIEKEQALVNANKELIQIFEQKIKDRIAKVWGTSVAPVITEKEETLAIASEPEMEYSAV